MSKRNEEIIDLTQDDVIDLTKDDSTQNNKNKFVVQHVGKKSNKTQLKEHQLNVLKSLKGQDGLLAVHRTGSGKTILGLAVRKQLHYLWQDEMKDQKEVSAVVIAPTKVKDQYESEMKRLGGVKKTSFKFYNYESLRNEKLCGEAKQFLEKNKYNILIFDEAHRLSNNESALANRASYIASSAKFVLCTTATPIVNSQSDLASLHKLITRTEKLPQNPKLFFRDFPILQDETIKNRKFLEDAFLNKISVFTQILPEEQVFYPDVVMKTIHVPMSKEQFKVYKAVEEKNLSKLKGVVNEDGSFDESKLGRLNAFMTKTRQLCNSSARFDTSNLYEEHNAPKMWEIYEYIQKHPKPAVVFSHFIEGGCDIMEQILLHMEVSFGVITGSSKKEPKEIVEAYNKREIDVLILSTAGSEGLDLKGTRQIHVVDQPWTDTRLQQVIGRGVRYKSHSHLPKSEQVVNVVQWICTKPNDAGGLRGGECDDEYDYYEDLEGGARTPKKRRSKKSPARRTPKKSPKRRTPKKSPVRRTPKKSPTKKLPEPTKEKIEVFSATKEGRKLDVFPTADQLLQLINTKKRQVTAKFMQVLDCASIESNVLKNRTKIRCSNNKQIEEVLF